MSHIRRMCMAVLLACAVLLAAVACTSSMATQGPPTSSATPSASPSTATSPVALTEAQKRDAVKQAWVDFWHVYDTILQRPQGTWSAAVHRVAVDPIAPQLLRQSRSQAKAGLGSYGYTVVHPYLTKSVGDKTTVTLWDCQDGSHGGSLVKATGVKKSVGRVDAFGSATMVRGTDGRWRVEQIKSYLDKTCSVRS